MAIIMRLVCAVLAQTSGDGASNASIDDRSNRCAAGLPLVVVKLRRANTLGLEVAMLTGTYRFPPMESVVYGRPFAAALREQVEASAAHSVFLLASGTIARETEMV